MAALLLGAFLLAWALSDSVTAGIGATLIVGGALAVYVAVRADAL
jgi:hypothetical protein